jgi:hypothetical protein
MALENKRMLRGTISLLSMEGRRVDETSLLVVVKKRRRWWGSARTSETPWKKVRSRFDSS